MGPTETSPLGAAESLPGTPSLEHTLARAAELESVLPDRIRERWAADEERANAQAWLQQLGYLDDAPEAPRSR